MSGSNQMALKLFRFAGIDVYIHWSWFLVAVFEINTRSGLYSSHIWNVLEYLALFAIVLLHEFGHALACRSVGGQAETILLWPLGGVAYVRAPERPGPTLWSIFAGPLVNILLIPVIGLAGMALKAAGLAAAWPDLFILIKAILAINIVILIFNLLPIYPLDGGQILRALLWFIIGRAYSLIVATFTGFIAVFLLGTLAYLQKSIWLGIIAVFILLNCWNGLRYALVLARLAKAPRREGFICPSCNLAPPRGGFWTCGNCKTSFDTFETGATCPSCTTTFDSTHCPNCGASSSFSEWLPRPDEPSPK